MNFKVGTKVKFLNDIGGGFIKRFQDDKVALVENEDGFEIPVLISELIPDEAAPPVNEERTSFSNHTKSYKSTATETVAEEEFYFNAAKQINVNAEDKAYLSFVMPEDDTAFPLQREIYLINDSDYQLFYTVNQVIKNKSKLLRAGMLEDNTKILIETVDLNNLDNEFDVQVQGVFFHTGYSPVNEPLNMRITPENFDIFNVDLYGKTDFFQEKAYSIILTGSFEEYIRQLPEDAIVKAGKLKERGSEQQQKNPKMAKKADIEEVDLHIEEILVDHRNLSAGEILTAQMDRFATALEGAMKSAVKKIVFIHGVGNGKLKYELRKKLDRKYAHLEYHDASFKEYGFGATMVILRRK